MLRIGKLTDYAIIVMIELARDPDGVLSAQVLAERTGIEAPTARKVLKALASDGLVRSYRGPSGGYRLQRSAADITVADIVAAIEGPIAMTECAIHAGLCTVEDHCAARGPWQRISEAVGDALRAVSLGDMAGFDNAAGRRPSLQVITRNA